MLVFWYLGVWWVEIAQGTGLLRSCHLVPGTPYLTSKEIEKQRWE